MTAMQRTAVWAIVLVGLVGLPAPAGLAFDHVASAPASFGAPIGPAIAAPATAVPAATSVHQAPSGLAHQVLARAQAAGISPRTMFLPNFNAETDLHGGVVHPIGTVAPAPMGLGDFGVRNTSGTAVPYVIQSTSWEGSLTLNSATSFLLDTGSPDTFTAQLNTVTTNTTVMTNTSGSYWIQNVFDYQPSLQSLVFLDNIWNFSSPAFAEPASTFYSYNGTPVPSVGFYYSYGPFLQIAMPFTVHLYVNTSTTVNPTTLIGYPTVRFGYNVLNASGGSVSHGVYDTVLFNSRLRAPFVPLTKFMVNGAKLTPTNFLLYDSEIMIGGPGGGTSATFYNINGSEQLRFLNGSTGRYQNDPTAWNIGTDTGETSEGIAEAYTHDGTVYLSGGPSIPVPLWNATPGGHRGIASIVGRVTPSNSFLFASPGLSFNDTIAAWAPTNVPYGAEGTLGTPPPSAAGGFNYTLPPGNYTFEALMSDRDPWTGNLTTTAGVNWLNISLPANTSQGVYTPLVAWDNQMLSNISSTGDGSDSNPYVLFNNQNGDLNPLFGELNDYLYAVFPGILLANTNASVRISHAASFHLTYPATYDRRLTRNGLPTTNNLQIEVYNASHVTLWDSTAISGWFFNQDYGPGGGLPLSNVVFWDVSDSLVAGNTFVSQGSSLEFMNGPSPGGGNVVWGNTFENGVQTSGMLNNGTSVGIWAFEAGDLIYNNYVATPYPAEALSFSEWYGGYQVNLDDWNLSGIEPESAQRVVNGITLSGSVVGSAWQCGNFWGNFVPNTPVPYTDGGLIQSGGDYCPYPLSPATYPVSFTETGLSLGYWSVTVENATVSAVAGAPISFMLPAGTWSYSVSGTAGYLPNPASGSFTLSGSAVTVAITFVGPPPPPPRFLVLFTETGLSYGSWSVGIGNETRSGVAGASIGFSELAGTYTYVVLPQPGYRVSPSTGTVTVPSLTNGTSPGAAYVAVVFSVPPPPPPPPTLYAVTFTEGGLGTGTAWSVTLNGTTESSFGSSIGFSMPNGSYAYSIGAVANYVVGTSTGTASVTGGSVGVAVTFTAKDGTLSGQVNVASATVLVNGNATATVNGSFSTPLPPGTYTIVVTASGYAAYANTVVVSPGKTTFVQIALTSVPTATAALSAAQSDGIIGAVVLLAIAVLVAGLIVRSRGRGGSPPTPAAPPAPWSEPPSGPKPP